jgi:hypothetical protein
MFRGGILLPKISEGRMPKQEISSQLKPGRMSFKAAFLFLVLFIQAFLVRAQNNPPRVFSPHQKQWEDGKLKLSDFKGRPPQTAQYRSELVYYIGFDSEKAKPRDSAIYRLKTYSYLDRDQSWMAPEADTVTLLRYNQALFNLVEIYERRLQYSLNRIADADLADPESSQIISQLKSEVAALGNETSFGQNAAAVQRWLIKSETELRSVARENTPPFRKRKFHYGLYGGPRFGNLTGTLGDNFTSPLGVAFGGDLGCNKSLLLLNGSWGNTEVDQQFTEERTWPANLKGGIWVIEVSYGYTLIDNAGLKLIPFAGWGMTRIRADHKNDVYEDFILTDHSFSGGLICDFKLRKRLFLIPSVFNTRETSEIGIRTRISICPLNYGFGVKGTLIQLSAGIHLHGGFLKML